MYERIAQIAKVPVIIKMRAMTVLSPVVNAVEMRMRIIAGLIQDA